MPGALVETRPSGYLSHPMSAVLRRILWSSCLGPVLLFGAGARAAAQEPSKITVAGEEREYILVTPASLSPGRHPLVLLLHGHFGTASGALGGSKLFPSPLAAWIGIGQREHLLVAALQGRKGADDHTGWHDCRADDVNNPRSDDVLFASHVVHELVASGRADPGRIYIMGMSNGAMMSLRLALEMRPAPAAVAAVSGTMAEHSECAKSAATPVSVLLIHGDADPVVPFAGGHVTLASKPISSVAGLEATRDFWLQADGLEQQTPVTSTFQHLSSDDPTRAVKSVYGSSSGPQVATIVIQRGGHVEPSLTYHYGPRYSSLVGLQNRDFESAEEAWAFFKDKQSRPPAR